MSASRSAKLEGREYAMHMDANDPLKNFREKFLIPPKVKSSMNHPLWEIKFNMLIGSFKQRQWR